LNRQASGTWRPLAALILLALIWGYNWVVMKKSLQFMGPFDFNALRMALGGVILLFFMLTKGMSLRPRQVPLTILLGLSQTAAGTGLILWALVSGGAGKTVILVYTMPFWILLFASSLMLLRVAIASATALILVLVFMALLVPAYVAAYLYAYRSPHLWEPSPSPAPPARGTR
jgi:drug/metabolite transporter (DMT)-like permease